MTCYHPLKAIVLRDKPNGKKELKFVSGCHVDADYKSFCFETIDIPCGKCIGCRLDYSREWANRCMIEAKKYEYNYMVTLTYDPEHITYNVGVDRDTGEVGVLNGTLVKSDMTKFMKDLRRYFDYHYGEQVRFFGCGEYGDLSYRPHLHILLFNCNIRDLKYFFSNFEGDPVYLSDTISSIWKKGNVTVSHLTWNTCAYVARYVVKKRKGKGSSDYYKKINVEPEFVRMSRNPGIARDYYDEHKKEIYDTDGILINYKNGVRKVRPSRYYDKLYDIDDNISMQLVKNSRKRFADYKQQLLMSKTDLTRTEYLNNCEETKEQVTKAIKRRKSFA